MTTIGTPLSPSATRLMLLGCGELGKEVVIEAQRLGVEVIGVDRYADAPAMQVAHRAHVIDMLDPAALRAVIERERPHFIVPEIEAIATAELLALEAEGFTVIPTARAARLTMDREGIRRLAAEQLGLADLALSLRQHGRGLSRRRRRARHALRREAGDVELRQGPERRAPPGGRAARLGLRADRRPRQRRELQLRTVIVEGFIEFDYEITQLTVRHAGGVSFCEPIGHLQVDGDYVESWQPHPMSERALAESRRIAAAVTGELGGRGIFGVELFVKGDQVWFSEVSPRPHDTGMVTMISQDLPQFALHVRAILGLPIPNIRQHGPSASAAILVPGDTANLRFENVEAALGEPDTALRLFGKPEVRGKRRMGVALARAGDVEAARDTARRMAKTIVAGARAG